MGLYSRYILPPLIEWACASRHLAGEREKIIPQARGRVLELGIGSGLSLPLYDAEKVEHLHGLDRSDLLWKRRCDGGPLPAPNMEFVEACAEKIPFPNAAFDTVVSTFTLCSVEDPEQVLSEVYRVLKDEGRFLIAEHGLAPDPGIVRYQQGINPIWRRIGGGCNLTRDINALLLEAGFDTKGIEENFVDGWRATAYHFVGVAMKGVGS